MKRICLLLACCLPFVGMAQKNIDELVNAEKSFAATAMTKGTKEAFLQYLDSASGIVFDKAEPVSAYSYWINREKRPGFLSWSPQVAEVSVKGDFGYTTGPWVFRMQRGDTALAQGQFVTVWHKINGQWKFLADLGISGSPFLALVQMRNDAPNTVAESPDTASLLKSENDFNKTFTTSPAAAYRRYLSSHSILQRNGEMPDGPGPTLDAHIAATNASIQLQSLGYGLAPAGDFAYTYGRATLNGKQDNYLRIWRREQKEWKIAVDLLRF
jgi:ketosteroid isomerase-like protein